MSHPTIHPTTRPKIKTSRTLPIPAMRPDQIDRFWFHIQRIDGSECWFWKGAASSTGGHGRVKLAGKLYSPHRVAYHLAKGAIPDDPSYHGRVVMHSCDTPRCCNPAHLVLGTQRENAQDMADKGRNSCPRGMLRPAHHKRGGRPARAELVSGRFA